MALTPDAKKLLAETIRGTQQDPDKGLRAKLLRAIHDEADRRYRLSVAIAEAGLDEAHRRRRERIEAWIDEHARAQKPKNAKELKATMERLLAQAEKEAAATLINRLVLLRQLEAAGLSRPQVVTGGWNSKGYREFREFAPALCTNGTTDATEGYATLLGLLFDELSIDLPGLYGDVGLTKLFTIPPAILREVIERLDEPELASAWTDDTTLGWAYQFWNDPDREALDAKTKDGGKIEPHEIASKTQMFTERYMVEWLLQNSLGLTWLAMCGKHGWTADAERVLPALDARRAEWRKKREAGEVALDALMPIEGELEDRWKYYVPQPIPTDSVEKAPDSVRALKLLDPACGSGHFLVIAFDLLAALHKEEARHRGRQVTDHEIAESILENNLHGIDIDPRAIQIAAAGLYLKSKALAKDARPKTLNLVAPTLRLGNLPATDPSVAHLREDLRREVGIPEELTNKLLTALAGVDHLGSLLKVDVAVEEALRTVELEFERTHGQGDLFGGFAAQQVKLTVEAAKATVLAKLEQFLSKHSKSEDLGLRLDGEQLTSGVRFVRMAKEGAYDIVVGNPPYQGIGKLAESRYYVRNYVEGRSDLLAGFYIRAMALLRPGGRCAFITTSNWMFLAGYVALRRHMRRYSLALVADLGKAAFTTGGTLISTACAVFDKVPAVGVAIAQRPHAPNEVIRDDGQPARTRASLLIQRGRYEFDPLGFEVVAGEPLVYWWSKEFLAKYADAPKLGQLAPVRLGLSTSDNPRFLRQVWELMPGHARREEGALLREYRHPGGWRPLISGSAGTSWMTPLTLLVRYAGDGLELRTSAAALVRNPDAHMRGGVAFTAIGSNFSARAHRYASMFDAVGRSVITLKVANTLANMNTQLGRFVMESLNPTVSFTAGDVERIPILEKTHSQAVLEQVDLAFTEHEASRESSVEFRHPNGSAWSYAQAWAQLVVDGPEGAPLRAYEPAYELPVPASFVSFAVGVALGRFDATGDGIVGAAPVTALPHGILFIGIEGTDSLEHAACSPLQCAWTDHGAHAGGGNDLRAYLRRSFFDLHRVLYENRPIYLPLSSAKRNFVAFASIHRWQADTLHVLLADHLVPTRRRLEVELEDLRTARASSTSKGKAEKRFAEVQKLLEELNDFIAKVTEVAENGPPPTDDKTPKREVNAKYVMDLDDGVMVNSAALWPLLEPQWKDPKKWWKELASAQGKKDYDWSHLAARYFATRVRAKCQEDPSLAVAHKCFWELHPAKAYAWELRLQDEVKPDVTIDEPGSDAARKRFLTEHDREGKDLHATELKRRERKAAKQDAEEDGEQPLLDRTDDDDADEGADD